MIEENRVIRPDQINSDPNNQVGSDQLPTQLRDKDGLPILLAAQPASYELYKPGDIDVDNFWQVMSSHRIEPGDKVRILPHGNQIAREKRLLYFGQAVGVDGKLSPTNRLPAVGKTETTRIISFGECNVACPYCKRDCQFIDEHGTPMASTEVLIEDIARIASGAVSRGEVIRFSGGDPVTHPKQTLALADWIDQEYGQKISVAHNGTGSAWVEKLLPRLSSAALDLKAVPEKLGKVMGIHEATGVRYFASSLKTQALISQSQVLLDVRTPVFGDTSVEEMNRLGEAIVGANNLDYSFWTWRLYKEVKGCDWPVPDQEKVIEMMKQVSAHYPALWMGMRAKWERGGMLFVKGGDVVENRP